MLAAAATGRRRTSLKHRCQALAAAWVRPAMDRDRGWGRSAFGSWGVIMRLRGHEDATGHRFGLVG